jgi:hypothetical protein
MYIEVPCSHTDCTNRCDTDYGRSNTQSFKRIKVGIELSGDMLYGFFDDGIRIFYVNSIRKGHTQSPFSILT